LAVDEVRFVGEASSSTSVAGRSDGSPGRQADARSVDADASRPEFLLREFQTQHIGLCRLPSGAAVALRERDQRVVDAPVDLEALARESCPLAIRALAGNADLVDAFLPRASP
jgi:hypothetical protein